MDLAEPSVIINTLIQLGMGAAGVLVGGTVAVCSEMVTPTTQSGSRWW